MANINLKENNSTVTIKILEELNEISNVVIYSTIQIPLYSWYISLESGLYHAECIPTDIDHVVYMC